MFPPVAGKLRRWSETFSSIPLRSNPFALPGPFVLSLWLLTQTAFFFSHPSFLPFVSESSIHGYNLYACITPLLTFLFITRVNRLYPQQRGAAQVCMQIKAQTNR